MKCSVEDVLVAGFRLRFGRTVLEAQIYWPPNPVPPADASLALMLGDWAVPQSLHSADLLGRGLSAGAGIAVLRVPDRAHCVAALRGQPITHTSLVADRIGSWLRVAA